MNRGRGLAVVAVAVLALAGGRLSARADQWIEVTSPHFTVVSNNGEKSVELAILTPRGNATPETLGHLRTWLTRAIELNPSYGPSYQSLTNVLLQMNLPNDALTLARKGVELEPGQFYTRMALANVLQRLSMKDEGLKEARAALTLAGSDAERRTAQSLIDAFDRIKRPSIQSVPWAIGPASRQK